MGLTRPGVVAFAFGVPGTILSNRRIAQIAEKLAKDLKAPIYTQRDVWIADLLKVKVEYTPEVIGKPPPTFRIVRGAIEWATRENLNELWVVAATPRLPRVLRDFSWAIDEFHDINIRVAEEMGFVPEEVWYSPDSRQKRTRSARDWQRAERVLNYLPPFLYKFIALHW